MLRRALALVAAIAGLAGVLVALPAGAAPERRVLLVGDSVMASLGPAYTDAAGRVIGGGGWAVETDAQVCRRLVATSCGSPRPATALEVVRAHAPLTGALVIGAGYNDQNPSSLRDAVRTILAEVPDVDVFWLTYSTGGTSAATYAAMNQVLAEEAAADPDLHVVDWDGARQPGWTGSDGLHLSAAGATGMATLILQHLDAWWQTTQCTPGPNTNPPASPSPASASGYWLLDSTGKIHRYGAAEDLGDLEGSGRVPASMQATPSGAGYWIVDTVGQVHAFGDAQALGDLRSARLNGPILRIEAHPTRPGYWLVASDGGVFAFDVPFLGSMGAAPLNQPVISMHATSDGDGYWLVARDGGVFSFGTAAFHGSTGAQRLNAPVISMAVAPGGAGYWLYAADGGVFSFDVPFHGSVPGTGLCGVPPTVAMRASATGHGYWVVTVTGRVFAFGDAVHLGDEPALAAGARVVDMATRR
jgi:lysophospholipase L1-like esterase